LANVEDPTQYDDPDYWKIAIANADVPGLK